MNGFLTLTISASAILKILELRRPGSYLMLPAILPGTTLYVDGGMTLDAGFAHGGQAAAWLRSDSQIKFQH